MKQIFITGNAGNDVEIFNDVNGKLFGAFQVAVRLNKTETEWMYVTCYDESLEYAKKHVKKGAKILVNGIPSVQLHVTKDGKTVANQRIYAKFIELQASKPDQFNRFDEYDYE